MLNKLIAIAIPVRATCRSFFFAALLPFIAVLAISLSGCTQLKVQSYEGGSVEGIPYALPNKIFLITVEYEVKECAVKSGKLLLDVNKTATATQLVEPGEQFYIPYSSIQNAFKDNDLVVESFDNSTLKSVSAQVTDKTGPAIAAITGGALRLLTLSASPLLLATGEPKAKADQRLRKLYCNERVVSVLDEINSLRKAKTDESALKIERLRGTLKFKQVVKWMPAKDSSVAGYSKVEKSIYPEYFLNDQTWLTAEGVKVLIEKYSQKAIDPKYPLEQLLTHITIDLFRPIVADPTLPKVLPGLIIRNPTQGLLRICDGHCPVQEGAVDGVVGATDVIVPQLGDYVILPLRNRIFQDQKIELTLSASGALQKVGINSKATAAAAADSFNTNFDKVQTTHDALEKAKEDARAASASQIGTVASNTTKINEALTACFAAQEALKKAGGVPVGTCQ
jgi:hypothetical protein